MRHSMSPKVTAAILLILMSGLLSVTESGATASMIHKQFADIYEIGQTEKAPLFRQETSIETTLAKTLWISEIRDAQNQVVMTERAEMSDGRVTSQIVEQRQIGERYELQVRDGEADFITYSLKEGAKGKILEQKRVRIGDRFVMGPMMQPYLRERWESLVNGQKVNVDFGVFEIGRSVGFEFQREGEAADRLKVKMKPSNLLLGWLVDPMHLEFDRETRKLKRFIGRTPLRVPDGKKQKVLDAEILYRETQPEPRALAGEQK